MTSEQYSKPKLLAKQRIISDIKSTDVRIQITGFVKDDTSEKNFTLKDNSGEITVSYIEGDFPLKKGMLINVIGEYEMNTEGDKSLNAEIIQDMKQLNFEYYEKIYHLKKDLI